MKEIKLIRGLALYYVSITFQIYEISSKFKEFSILSASLILCRVHDIQWRSPSKRTMENPFEYPRVGRVSMEPCNMGCTSHDKHGYKNGILREIRFHVVPHFTRPRRDTSDAEERGLPVVGSFFVYWINVTPWCLIWIWFGSICRVYWTMEYQLL